MFTIVEEPYLYKGRVVYIESEYSISFIPRRSCNCSFLLQTLELEWDSIKNCAMQVGGYFPKARWIFQKLSVPEFVTGRLVVEEGWIDDADIVQLDIANNWKAYYDQNTGWLCFGNFNAESQDEAVLFTTDTGAVINQGLLKAIWLKPEMVRFVPEL